MSTDLFAAFKNTLSRRWMWRPGESVLAAVSGGPDSTCLLSLFVELREESPFPLAVAHLNHGLRNRESDADEAFAAELARRSGLPFHSRRLPKGHLSGTGVGLEAAARRVRYGFLEETARGIGAVRVAVGHTRDDQAETLLLRLLRGSGPRGLAGIYPIVEGLFIRPLLDITRQEVAAYLEDRGLPCRTDTTNRDPARTRNRIRHRLLPLIREEFNPEIDRTLARTAGILREEEAYLDGVTRDLAGRLLRRDEAGLYLSIPALRVLPAALRRRLLRKALEEATPSTPGVAPDYGLLEMIQELIEDGRHGAAVTLEPRLEARVIYADLALLPGAREEAQRDAEVPLPVPGEATLPYLGVRLKAEQVAAARIGDPKSGAAPDRALLDADALPGPLVVRARRPGDAFRPLGSPGEAKLKFYLIDHKVPRPIRDRIPLVVSGSRIAWVVGYQIDDRFKVTPETRRVLVLSKEMQ